jgi:hypothetical protein
LLFNWTLKIRLILCEHFTIVNWIFLKLKGTLQCCTFKYKRYDSITLCCDFSWMIGSNEMVCSKILSCLETSLTTWLSCFVKCFLWTTKSFWTLSRISKGGVSSFLRLCSNFYVGCKANVVKGRLLLGFDNAFTIAL